MKFKGQGKINICGFEYKKDIADSRGGGGVRAPKKPLYPRLRSMVKCNFCITSTVRVHMDACLPESLFGGVKLADLTALYQAGGLPWHPNSVNTNRHVFKRWTDTGCHRATGTTRKHGECHKTSKKGVVLDKNSYTCISFSFLQIQHNKG